MQRPAHWLPIVAVLLLAILATAPVSAAEPGEIEGVRTRDYTTPLVIPAAAFVNDGNNPEGYEYLKYLFAAGAPANFVAPVYLPSSAQVSGFSAYLRDPYSSGDPDCTGLLVDIRLKLVRVPFFADPAAGQDVAHLSTSGSSSSVQYVASSDIDPTRNTIDNFFYNYYVLAEMCAGSHQLNAVVIDY